MKHINKKEEPQAFNKWKNLANEDWQPTYDDLSGIEKRAVFDALIAKQGGLCCYCERTLEADDYHIEHFKPQSHPAVDPLDFVNMLCSCQNQLKKGEPRHCGNLKGNWYDAMLLVSPLDSDCENRFSFTGDGKIEATSATDNAAITTIQKLGLGIPKLNALRASAIVPFLDDALNEDEMRRFITGYLEESADHHFNEFWTTIHALFGDS